MSSGISGAGLALCMLQQIGVFTDSGFWKGSLAHAVMTTTESCLYLDSHIFLNGIT